MKNRYRFLRKSYAMTRMAEAIERAIEATTIKEKDRAARWAAAWGLLCGIKTRPVNLKRSEIGHLHAAEAADKAVASIGFPEIDFSSGESISPQSVACSSGQPPLPGPPASHS